MVLIEPPLQDLQAHLNAATNNPNVVPVFTSIPANDLPATAYLKISQHSKYSFLLESVTGGEQLGRYSFIGADPYKVTTSGPGHGKEEDPLIGLEQDLNTYRTVAIPGVPPFSGGAIGYIAYDCVRYFEPKTRRDLKDPLGIPESLMMFHDSVVCFDHIKSSLTIVTHIHLESDTDLSEAYEEAGKTIQKLVAILQSKSIPEVPQGPIELNQEYTSNIGKEGYEAHVTRLKQHIQKGDIIQAVPSQRISRPTDLHPFNIYRELRQVNPSPYMFYINCGDDFQIIGASPELLVKEENGRVLTHPIAGTVHRGKTVEEDDRLANELLSSTKDRAEHVMLVDLARNDINRVCDTRTTRVDRFMTVERFSHVSHLVSQVSGVLRQGKNRFDAFRSIFPAGTVSGAPKVKAMELIAELEGEKRGVYAGAIGRWGYDETSMDTCIAIRTMTYKDGVVYLQAGGGIVFDSVQEDEYVETLNKLKANMTTIKKAEERLHASQQQNSIV
ncbi:putative Anthranilate synthase component I [Taphrina deformans PYCC 5710]|uniref:anthranilate synthase n=1 Tax=Taphrina deformans (strain PYCC 5710 / ATCC 11124 / CBS 356.35 / IMI 108563 / JCM 9778 / NBRC 8474) TaxID=1097556 RepID=R4XBC5_TAPDE|nr:putative Anthranilate synthase component I [Taphrina deformans PYCC 5710]|eukprot:CCG80633.1 putative Anthranilate synthase component I [Taphrina deformans PYCC 5710]